MLLLCGNYLKLREFGVRGCRQGPALGSFYLPEDGDSRRKAPIISPERKMNLCYRRGDWRWHYTAHMAFIMGCRLFWGPVHLSQESFIPHEVAYAPLFSLMKRVYMAPAFTGIWAFILPSCDGLMHIKNLDTFSPVSLPVVSLFQRVLSNLHR